MNHHRILSSLCLSLASLLAGTTASAQLAPTPPSGPPIMPRGQKAPDKPNMDFAEAAKKGFQQLHDKLGITAAQEPLWAEFLNGHTAPLDLSNTHKFFQAKTVPDVYAAMEGMQQAMANRLAFQKKTTLALYEVLNAKQKAQLDEVVVGGMMQLVPPNIRAGIKQDPPNARP